MKLAWPEHRTKNGYVYKTKWPKAADVDYDEEAAEFTCWYVKNRHLNGGAGERRWWVPVTQPADYLEANEARKSFQRRDPEGCYVVRDVVKALEFCDPEAPTASC